MFVGHAAAALAAKRLAPDTSLGVLLGASVWLDLVWPILLLLGIEHVRIDPGNTAFTPLDFYDYPWTHSLVLALAWSTAAVFVFRPGRARRSAALIGALVLSHWVLDLVVHRPDLPLWPGSSPKLGLGLWNSIPGTLALEGAMLMGGAAVYTRAWRPRRRVASFALWSLLTVYVVIWLANLVSPPPPSPQAIAWAGIAGWLLPVWAWWADRNREVSPAGVGSARR